MEKGKDNTEGRIMKVQLTHRNRAHGINNEIEKSIYTIDEFDVFMQRVDEDKGDKSIYIGMENKTNYDQFEDTSSSSKRMKNDESSSVLIKNVLDILIRGPSSTSSSKYFSSSMLYPLSQVYLSIGDDRVDSEVFKKIGDFLHKNTHVLEFKLYTNYQIPVSMYKNNTMPRLLGNHTLKMFEYKVLDIEKDMGEIFDSVIQTLDNTYIHYISIGDIYLSHYEEDYSAQLDKCEILCFRNKLLSREDAYVYEYSAIHEDIMRGMSEQLNKYGVEYMNQMVLHIDDDDITDDVLKDFFELLFSNKNISLEKISFKGHMSDNMMMFLLENIIGNTCIKMLSFVHATGYEKYIEEIIELPKTTELIEIHVSGQLIGDTDVGKARGKRLKENLRLTGDEREIPIKSNSKSAAKISAST